MKKYNIAVVGATGNVGRSLIKILDERNFPIDNIYAVASERSVGKKISFGEKSEILVSKLDGFDFKHIDMVFMCAGSDISQKYCEKIKKSGCLIVDKSSYYRMNPNIPLIVPEANSHLLKNITPPSIISNPNCCVIPIVVALKPLDNAAKIKRIIASTYQSVSGAGKKAMDELYDQTKAKYSFMDIKSKYFEKQIAFNLIPKIGDFDEDGNSSEETKIIQEFSKIMQRNIKMSITCVRIPVFIGHSISLNVEFESNLSKLEVEELLSEYDNIGLIRDNNIITPIDTVGEDNVFVSRVREDKSKPNTINLWIGSDNLLKGAALNSVQIVESYFGINNDV